MSCCSYTIPYSAIFSREKFFHESPVCTAKWKFWWENFRGAAKTKPCLSNTCYAIFDRSSLFREQRRHECELESMILSNLSLLFGSAVKWSYAPAPAFLSRSLPVVWLSRLYWQLQCWKPVPALIANHRAVVVPRTTPQYLYGIDIFPTTCTPQSPTCQPYPQPVNICSTLHVQHLACTHDLTYHMQWHTL